MKQVFGIAGEISSGKGTAASYLVTNYGANSRAFSDSLKDVADRMYIEKNRENLQKISSIFRQNFYDNILSQVVFNDVQKDESEIIVIDGVRRLADIDFFEKVEGFKLIYIEADLETRYERITNRSEKADDRTKTFNDFKKDHEREAEVEIKTLRKVADFILVNNGSFEDLYQQIDKIVK